MYIVEDKGADRSGVVGGSGIRDITPYIERDLREDRERGKKVKNLANSGKRNENPISSHSPDYTLITIFHIKYRITGWRESGSTPPLLPQ